MKLNQIKDEKVSLLELEEQVMRNLYLLNDVLNNASNNRFISPEHAKTVWQAYLKVSGLDIPKKK